MVIDSSFHSLGAVQENAVSIFCVCCWHSLQRRMGQSEMFFVECKESAFHMLSQIVSLL